MRHWSRSDIIGIINIAVAILGFVAMIAQALPSLLPEVALIVEESSDSMVGLSTFTATFHNASYKIPISNMEAAWEIEGDGVELAVDPGAPTYQLESPDKRRRVLRLVDPLPARYKFRTVFNAARPFQIFSFRARASTISVSPQGPLVSDVPILRTNSFGYLESQRYKNAALVLAAWVIGCIFLFLLGKRLANPGGKHNVQ